MEEEKDYVYTPSFKFKVIGHEKHDSIHICLNKDC